MGLYRWNSGGQYRGKLWEQDLLADSQVCFDTVPRSIPGLLTSWAIIQVFFFFFVFYR